MIKKIAIKNFKSLAKIELTLGQFNCLIGMNGAGKTTIIQAIDFISNLLAGEVRAWLDGRGWDAHDLNCKLRKENNITLFIEFQTNSEEQLSWIGNFNRSTLRCTEEIVTLNSEKVFQSTAQKYRLYNNLWQDVSFIYEGSILSQLKPSELPDPILEFLGAIRRIRSLELLSPHLMRKRARTNDVDIGAGGEKLSAYLYGIKGEDKNRLIGLLKGFYPNLVDYKVSSMKAGWKKLLAIELFNNQKLETEAAHLSDGLLRILAILAQAESDRSLILLDEIENGINPEIIEKLVETLLASQQQILVTTHSPMILNYLEDETARESVQFIYKTPTGETRARHFFEIPRVGEKLRWMGPGEAFVDTDLRALTEECIALDLAESSGNVPA